jgi:hypothetical protein
MKAAFPPSALLAFLLGGLASQASSASEASLEARVAVGGQGERAALEFFEQKVRPLLVEKCHACHSEKAGKQKGGLHLDSREAILRGGDSGAAASPGGAAGSLLLRAVQYLEPDLQMPPKERLAPQEVAVLERWIWEGMA